MDTDSKQDAITSLSANNSEITSLRGIVERVTYRNPDNSYAVLQVAVEDQRECVTVVGYVLPFVVGSHILVQGSYISHPKFGLQFQAKQADEIEPATPQAIEKYLGSGLITGVGPKTAERIVKAFGTEAMEVILRSPEKLRKIPGISKAKAALISSTLNQYKEKQENERFFIEHNISRGLAKRIIERYGEKAISQVKKDPYKLAYEMQGVGFATADSIALNLGFEPSSVARLRGGLYYALQKAMDDGHCYLTRKLLLEKANYLLGLSDAVDFCPHIESLQKEGFIICEEDKIYIQQLYDAEEFVANFIAERTEPYNNPALNTDLIQSFLQDAEKELGLTFSTEQRHAVYLAVNYPFLIITGGPGCGKTTLVKALAATYSRSGKVLALAAPTGKAAQRMAQVTGMQASTIHRLLKYDPRSNSFQYNITNPLRIEEQQDALVDAIIIDEASMLDIQLARDLFSAIPKSATLILVGDKDQLPSVGPGRVFAELVHVQETKVVSLSQLFRRSEESIITSLAHRINAGIEMSIPEPDGNTVSDAYYIPRDNQEECAKVIENLVGDQIPRKFGIPKSDITVLTPSNRGPLGTLELNRLLQNRLNPKKENSSSIKAGQIEFRIGDRVCQRVNNYKIDLLGVFNGDVGEIYQVDEEHNSIVVELWDGRLIRYNENDLKQLSLSYAMTIHRSQGSEMPCVVLVLHTSHFTLLERQLFYTAVTRAKKLLVIVGSRRALSIAAKKVSSKRRLTSLKQRISNILI